jgi:hypothetical protein
MTFHKWLLERDDDICEAVQVFIEANSHSDEFCPFSEIMGARVEYNEFMTVVVDEMITLRDFVLTPEYRERYIALLPEIAERKTEAYQLKQAEKAKAAAAQALQAHVRMLLVSTREEEALKDMLCSMTHKSCVWFVAVNEDHILGSKEGFLVALKEVVMSMTPAEIAVLNKHRKME